MPDELLDLIDDNDIVIGQATRARVHAEGLWHRGAHILLFDGRGCLLVQKRSADRRQYASLLDCSVSEHVRAGESYLEAAQRGLAEELGLTSVTLSPTFKFKMNYGPNDNEVSAVFEGEANPLEVQFDPQEVSEVAYIPPTELLAGMEQRPQEFCGWFIQIMKFRSGLPVEFQMA